MRILILGINYPPEKIGISVYTGDLARALAHAGHDVQVVTAPPYYPEWRVQSGYRRRWWGRQVLEGVKVVRCPIYVPHNPNGLERLLHHVSFALSALPLVLWHGLRHRPDAVLCVAPSLIATPLGWAAARMGGSVAWLHVQDFEVDAAVATGLVGSGSRLVGWAKKVERLIMRAFDRVSSIGPEMCQRLIDIGVEPGRVRQMRNWADIRAVVPQASETSPFRREWNITTPYVALYSGNIANKQGIEIVGAAAHRLRHRKDLTFVICGAGPKLAFLEQQTSGNGNIVFADLQPKERLSDLLALASVHLLPQKRDAADLVLPSKLTNMLASGRPVIATAVPGTGLAREVEGCGIVVSPEDDAAFATAIETLLDQASLREEYGRAARQRAEREWDKDVIVASFTAELEGTIVSHRLIKGKTR